MPPPVRISELPDGGTLGASDDIVIARAGTSYKARGISSVAAPGDVVINPDSDASSAGDLIFKVAGAEHGRLTNAGMLQFTTAGRKLALSGDLPGYGSVSQAIRDAHINAYDLVKLTVVPTYSDGTNGTRGDSITSDAANTGGHSTWAPFMAYAPSFSEKGSNHLAALIGIVDPPGAGDAYSEFINLYAVNTVNRKGALAEVGEWGLIVNQPSRSQGLSLLISQNIATSAYAATLGGSSAWSLTGSRGLWVKSNGTSPLGTGIYLDGNMEAGIRVAPAGAGQIVLQSQRAGENYPRFTLNEAGLLSWGTGAATPDATGFTRQGAATIKSASQVASDGEIVARYAVAGQVLIGLAGGQASIVFGSSQDTSLFRNGAAGWLKTTGKLQGDLMTVTASVTTARTGGAASALPAAPVRYLAVLDENGNRMYVPAYS